MKVLLIDNYDSFTYNIVELLRQLSVEEVVVVKNDEIDVKEAAHFEHIIISPGPATPSESGQILHIIQALSSSHKILGICLGHQAIAEAFGGRLKNLSMPYHGHQTTLNRLKPHVIFDECPVGIDLQVGLYHSWTVDEESLPDCLDITSVSTEKNIMSIKHKVLNVHGIQFHPESYLSPYGKEMLAGWLKAR